MNSMLSTLQGTVLKLLILIFQRWLRLDCDTSSSTIQAATSGQINSITDGQVVETAEGTQVRTSEMSTTATVTKRSLLLIL